MAKVDNGTQVVVVGGGPGGYAAAFLAADLGVDVVLVDRERNPGGVCLYRGCIPSKALLHVAETIHQAADAEAWGVSFSPPEIDVERIRAWKDEVVEKLTDGLGQLSKQRKVRYVRGAAKLVDGHTVEIDASGDTRRLSAEHIILATGSRPARPGSLSLESDRVLDSTSALDLGRVPETLLVVGGGYIGLELGTVYAALGSRVSVVEMLPGLLPGVDRDLVSVLSKRLEGTLEAIHLTTRVTEMKEVDKGIRVRFEGEGEAPGEEVYDQVLVAVGRKPNSEIPGLDNTRVKIDDRGFIEVDGQRRTAEPSIFAIGDVAGEPMLAHKASHEGRVAAEVIAGHAAAFEPRAIPAVVFTDPEIAWCGLTESQARDGERPYKAVRFPWAASGRAMTLGRTEGLTKLLIDPETERILGAGIVGPGAGDLISEAVLAIEMAATASDLKLTIHPHPTLSETLMEAAEVFFGQSTHVYRPKRENGKK